ncbi:MAG: c-type cytochrome [Halofilum sp. (in: g-proteobacteria)]|nr:c-type cytochrome [Halofilum sp. (in: g-proteobacteria)]
MKKLLTGLTLAAMAVFGPAALAADAAGVGVGGDPEAGKSLSQTCVGCHGTDGNSPQGMWPNLGGQHAGYLFQQLQHFKAGKLRYNAQMAGMVAGLSEQDMRDLAAYYAGQPHKVMGASDEALVEQGEKIYLGGIASKNVAACVACHGPRGRGNPAADYPRVGGQWAQYLVTQLQQFSAGHGYEPEGQIPANMRASDPNAMMRSLSAEMTEQEMRAVSEYMAGLH